MKCTATQVLAAPDWIVRRALFHASAKSQGQMDKWENEQARVKGMKQAYG